MFGLFYPPNYALWFKLPLNIIYLFHFSMYRWSFKLKFYKILVEGSKLNFFLKITQNLTRNNTSCRWLRTQKLLKWNPYTHTHIHTYSLTHTYTHSHSLLLSLTPRHILTLSLTPRHIRIKDKLIYLVQEFFSNIFKQYLI